MKTKKPLLKRAYKNIIRRPLSQVTKKFSGKKVFRDDLKLFQSQEESSRGFAPLSSKDFYPILNEKTSETSFEPHYTYHPAWAARVLARSNPKKHVDISSALFFSTMVSAFIPIKFYDYRPANLHLNQLESDFADLLTLPFENNSIPSLSCMHVVEHVGLGRYGDPIDFNGDIKAMKELERVLAKGGQLLFVVPISGRARIEFNAHRVYSYAQIRKSFANLELVEFSLIPDKFEDVGIIENATEVQANEQSHGCGCFLFTKK